jgi:hypothetical protein
MGDLIYEEDFTVLPPRIMIILYYALPLIAFLILFYISRNYTWIFFIFLFVCAAIINPPKLKVFYYSNGVKLTRSRLSNIMILPMETLKEISVLQLNPKYDKILLGLFGVGKFTGTFRWPQFGWPKFLSRNSAVLVETKQGKKYLIGSRNHEDVVNKIKDYISNELIRSAAELQVKGEVNNG